MRRLLGTPSASAQLRQFFRLLQRELGVAYLIHNIPYSKPTSLFQKNAKICQRLPGKCVSYAVLVHVNLADLARLQRRETRLEVPRRYQRVLHSPRNEDWLVHKTSLGCMFVSDALELLLQRQVAHQAEDARKAAGILGREAKYQRQGASLAESTDSDAVRGDISGIYVFYDGDDVAAALHDALVIFLVFKLRAWGGALCEFGGPVPRACHGISVLGGSGQNPECMWKLVRVLVLIDEICKMC